MTSARECRGEPNADNLQRQLYRNGSLAKREHVRIIVLACPPGSVVAPAQRAADAAHLVGCDGLAVARAAQNDAAFALAACDSFGRWSNEDWIIDGRVACSAEVTDLVTQ